jgi:hypothetical protein
MTASTATTVQAIHGESSANEFHRRSVAALRAVEVPFLIGGAYMVEVCGGVSRSTKDFDLYVRPNHMKAALRALARARYKTELTFPHWLAKATYEGDIVNLIFRAGNGLCEVDDSWFDRARDDELLGVPVKHCAPEEIDLDESVHHGTRTVRRRRHRAHSSLLRGRDRLAAPGSPVRS